jgi:hypothetical protein
MVGCFCFANALGFLFGPSQKGTICSSVCIVANIVEKRGSLSMDATNNG